jgi:hypothetical protein
MGVIWKHILVCVYNRAQQPFLENVVLQQFTSKTKLEILDKVGGILIAQNRPNKTMPFTQLQDLMK